MVIVEFDVSDQRLLKVFTGIEAMGFENIGDPSVKPFHHAVGLGMSGRGQPVFNTQRLAELIELVFSAGFTFTVAE